MKSHRLVLCLLALAACKKDYHYDDGDLPVPVIVTPHAGADLCPTVEIEVGVTGDLAGVTFTCSIDGGNERACSVHDSFQDLADGDHTLTVVASNDAGESDPVTVTFHVDGVGPTATAAATAGAAGSGDGTLEVTVTSEETSVAVTAGIELTDGVDQTSLVDACTCAATSCACTGLAPGWNHLAATLTDACGNTADVATDVYEDYGPNLGHAILIGHDYTDASTPGLVGSAAALSRFAGRTDARVLAWRAPGWSDEAVANVEASLDASLEAHTTTEIADPALLPDALRGRDVLVLYEPGDAYTDVELDQLADDWASALDDFTAAGGIVVALHASQGWRLLAGGDEPLIALDDGYNVDGSTDLGAPDDVLARYPTSALGTTGGYPLLADADDDYQRPEGSGCVGVSDATATVLADYISGSCNDGCFYYTCPIVVDQVLPRHQLAVDPTEPVTPYPACVPIQWGLDSGGVFSSDTTGDFVCTTQTAAGYLASPFTIAGCSVTAQDTGAYTVSLASAPREGIYVDVTQLDAAGTPVRSARTYVDVESYVFASAFSIAANACTAGYVAEEYAPSIDSTCQAQVGGPNGYLPYQSITCVLQKDGVTVSTHTNAACGAIADPNGGFTSSTGQTVNWGSEIAAAGNGNYTDTITLHDYHGNTSTTGHSWTMSTASSCPPG